MKRERRVRRENADRGEGREWRRERERERERECDREGGATLQGSQSRNKLTFKQSKNFCK